MILYNNNITKNEQDFNHDICWKKSNYNKLFQEFEWPAWGDPI